MPQAGFTPIQTYNSPTAGHIPVNTDLYAGELAINTTDEKLYFKNTGGTVKLLASTAVFTTTGTGSYVLATSPTITGHPTIEGVTSTGATGTGKFVFDSAPTITGHPTIEGVTSTGATGTGKFVFDSAPTITGHPTIEGVTSTGATGTGKFVFDSAPTITGHPTIEGVTSTGATGTGKFVFDSAPTITGHPTIEGVTSTGATGTGKFVFDSAPTITGHPTIEGVTSTGATGTGKFVFDSAPTITGHPTIEGVTSTGATGTGKFVFDSSPTLSGVTLSDGTANGVAYLNSSKVLTTGSGLVYDSSGNLGLDVVPSAWRTAEKAFQVGQTTALTDISNFSVIRNNNYVISSGTEIYSTTGSALALVMSSSGEYRFLTAPSGTAGNAISFTQAMTLDSSGNLLVGTTSGSGAKLEVHGSIQSTTDFNSTAVNSSLVWSGVGNYVSLNANNGILDFYTGVVGYGKHMTLDSSGNLGLGVVPSAWGSSGTLQALQIKNSSFAGAGNNSYWGANWYGGGFDKYIANGYASLLIQTAGGFNFLTAPSGTAGDAISFTQAMTLDSSGNLLVGKTSATSNGGDVQVSKGVSFPATQVACSDPNTLDDYEEGTWTPSTFTSGLSVSSISSAFYTKIGRQVTCYCYITLNNASGSSKTEYVISGLPFTTIGFGFAVEYYNGGSTVATGGQYVETNNSYVNIFGAALDTGSSVHMLYMSYFV